MPEIVIGEEDSYKVLKFIQVLELAHQEKARKEEEDRMRRIREDKDMLVQLLTHLFIPILNPYHTYIYYFDMFCRI